MNALTHGLTAQTVLLPGEDPAALKLLAESLVALYRPANDEEFLLVEEIVANKWRIRRSWSTEQRLIRTEMLRRQQDVQAEFEHAESDIVFALAFRELTDNSKSLAHAHRQEVRYERAAAHALEQLRAAQTLRKEQEAAEQLHTPESPTTGPVDNGNADNHLDRPNAKIQINPEPPETCLRQGVSEERSEILETPPAHEEAR
ncbi:MAG: hypothetical protein R2762_26815 [Bryobacteraceae bacterium]